MKSLWFKKVNRSQGWLALPAITLTLAFCHSESGIAPVAASGSSGGGMGGDGGASASVGVFVGSGNAASGTGGNGVPMADAGIPDGAFPPEPMVTCDPASDAGSDLLCPLPDPTCALERWLVYYKNPECVDGSCHFEAVVYDCWPDPCYSGGCYLNMTAI